MPEHTKAGQFASNHHLSLGSAAAGRACGRLRQIPLLRAAALIAFCICLTPHLFARDVFVLISGGGSPFDNNYSQYLQARGLVSYFFANYPPDSIWVFFGAGNVEGQKPVFSDVYRQTQRDGVSVDSWLPGALRQNLPAKHEVILRTLREQILPAVADGGTLFLFVGDHGSRSHGRNPESIITLWDLKRDPDSEHGWRDDGDESLGVWELRRTLARGLGRGRVVFCMTQCHAGGFHYLAVPHEMSANKNWFTLVPSWTFAKDQPEFVPAAGFTATDEFSMASGCNPSPDPASWAGYERYIPENLIGIDLFTLKSTGHGLASFAEAHAAATLEDRTIDKPYSTSEQYLERWARLIETRLLKEPNLTSKVKRAVANYQRAVDGATPKLSDPAFKERQALFRRFTDNLWQQDPRLQKVLVTGTRHQLETMAGPSREIEKIVLDTEPSIQQGPSQPQTQTQPTTPNRPRRGGGPGGDRRRLYNETIRPAWQALVTSGHAPGLPAAASAFEEYLLGKEARGSNFGNGGGHALQEEVFWQAGYADPRTLDPVKAETISLWAAERRTKILAWAATSEDASVRAAAERMSQQRRSRRQPDPTSMDHMHTGPEPIDDQTAAQRALFYRRVLAAWQFLIVVDERPALARIQELTALERTPLPARNQRAQAR